MASVKHFKDGTPYLLVGIKVPEGKTFGRGFAEIGGKLYKLTVSPSNKDGIQCWVSITKPQPRKQFEGFSGQHGSGYGVMKGGF